MSYIYLTSGTIDFMEKLSNKYLHQKMFILYGAEQALLLHESTKKTVFATPRKFEVIDQLNEIEQRGFFVLNHIPVSDEGREVFEHRLLNRPMDLVKEPGFIAYRLLRPIKSETYVILTQWTGPASYGAWKNSNSFEQAQWTKEDTPGIKKQNIFNAASYEATYSGVIQKKDKEGDVDSL